MKKTLIISILAAVLSVVASGAVSAQAKIEYPIDKEVLKKADFEKLMDAPRTLC